MPMSVNGVPFTAIVRPIAALSAPSRDVQNAWETTSTGWVISVVSSSGAKNRPSAGRTPRRVKKLPLTRLP
jgi:hypothetical protein